MKDFLDYAFTCIYWVLAFPFICIGFVFALIYDISESSFKYLDKIIRFLEKHIKYRWEETL